jgi:RluA family pseudouridine synthase
VLHLDPWLIVLDKPPGMPVHAGPAGEDHLERHLPALRFGYAAPPQPAHRLDRDTSGCLALGRHRRALKRLGRLFEEKRATKTYWAVVEGVPATPRGRIDRPVAKVNGPRGWRMVIDDAGRPAVTDWQRLASDGARSWLALTPRTGRTHQLRLHLAALGWPIVGDGLYGTGAGREGPLLLHARALTLPMEVEKPPVHVEAPVPPSLAAAIAALGGTPPASS